jgi:hypothetical protein
MSDFDQINRMSTQLIEQLQSELDHYKSGGAFNNMSNVQ